MHTIDPSSSAATGFAISAVMDGGLSSGASSLGAAEGSGSTEVLEATVMQEEIWIGIPGAGESAAMDHTFENDRLAEACVCKKRD